MQKEYIVVLVTAKDYTEAETISRQLLAEKLIACANIVEDVKSLFWWKGKIDEAAEVLLTAKSRADLFPDLCAMVKKYHSYSVPEVVSLPITDGNPDYLKWIDESCRGC